jgi:DNA-binding NtrC family response regulator
VGGLAEKAGETETAPAPAWEGADLTGVERSMIERAMQEAGGNQTRAAQRLGISRDTLRYRLKKFGLQGG